MRLEKVGGVGGGSKGGRGDQARLLPCIMSPMAEPTHASEWQKLMAGTLRRDNRRLLWKEECLHVPSFAILNSWSQVHWSLIEAASRTSTQIKLRDQTGVRPLSPRSSPSRCSSVRTSEYSTCESFVGSPSTVRNPAEHPGLVSRVAVSRYLMRRYALALWEARY